MNRGLALLTGLSLALGAVGAAGLLLAADRLDDEESVAPAATAEATTTPGPEERFLEDFTPLGCQLMDFAAKLNDWTVSAQERGDRLEILGGIGFWREILAGLSPQIEQLPSAETELRAAASGYVAALDTYLATVGEYWFTAQQPAGQAALDRLAFAEQQGLLLQAEAEEAAGGPFNLQCPDQL